MPKTTEAPRQPSDGERAGPASAAMTVPTLPPEMWALIAKPRRSGGNCSARRPLPTGCWGEPPIRETTLATPKVTNDWASAWAAKPSAEEEPAGGEERAPGDVSGDEAVGRLDRARS